MITADDPILKAELTLDEGRVPYLYDDTTLGKRFVRGDTLEGALTGGIGFNFSVNGLPNVVIDQLYQFVADDRFAGIQRVLPWWVGLSDVRQRVLMNIAFQSGLGGLLKFSNMLAYARAGQFDPASAEIIDSRIAPNRRARLAQQMLKG